MKRLESKSSNQSLWANEIYNDVIKLLVNSAIYSPLSPPSLEFQVKQGQLYLLVAEQLPSGAFKTLKWYSFEGNVYINIMQTRTIMSVNKNS